MIYPDNKIQVGISSCLMGEKVRYDGGHKLSVLCNTKLAEIFEFILICPEVGAGMGIPREPVQLMQTENRIQVVQVSNTSIDKTLALQKYANESLSKLTHLNGFVLKSRSPSCGMSEVKVHNSAGHIINTDGTGIFAKTLRKTFPDMPIEDEQRLQDEEIKQSFVASVLAYAAANQLHRPT